MDDYKARSLKSELRDGAYLVLGFAILIWVIELVNLVLGQHLGVYGVRPRSVGGLPGIVLAPLLHASIAHVLANTIPFLILGSLVVLHGTDVLIRVTAFVVIVGDSMVWLLARPSIHIGASGLIMGYFGFLVAQAWYERSVGSLLLAVLAVLIYGGALWGILPVVGYGISWEMHLFGLLAGVLAARLGVGGGRDRSKRDEPRY